jgi:dihydrofolate synthase/folylpolyglutamate synthase
MGKHRTSVPRRASSYLASRTRLGMKFGLETTRLLVEALGHPERCYTTLLVAGTNGKGSVVAYTDAVLRASGLRVGRYTSPHLVNVFERIAVGGRAIAPRAFEAAVGSVRAAAVDLVRAGRIADHPTFFEALTVAAFEHFRRRRVDAAVLEVGMGARLDATNVAEPVASAIVSIDRDHEQFLGSTLGAIAVEKAGVLRSGRTTVLGPLAAEARRAIEARAKQVGARLVDAAQGSRFEETAAGLTLHTPGGRYAGLKPLPGAHQRANLLVAVRLLEELQDAGLAVDLAVVPSAVARTRWPGRLQWIRGRQPLLLDGAHNPAAARALAQHLRSLQPFVLLFGVMADKDVPGLAQELFPLAAHVVLTQPKVGRAATPAAIAARVGALALGARREPGVAKALTLARRLAPPGRPIVVAGSLYLVGEVLRLVTKPRK